jgi:hypothetical protein
MLQFRTHTYRTVLTRSNSPVLLLYPCPSQARGRTGRQLGGGLVTSRCCSRRAPCVRAELNRNWSWCTAAHVVAQETTVSDLATTQTGAVLLQRQHDSSLGRLAQSSLQEQSPSYPPCCPCVHHIFSTSPPQFAIPPCSLTQEIKKGLR